MRISPAAAILLACLAVFLSACGPDQEASVHEVVVQETTVKKVTGTPAVTASAAEAPPAKTVAPPGVTDPTPPAAAQDATTVTLEIAGLHCERDCVPRVKAMLGHAAGVESVTVDYAAKQAVVRVRAGTVPEDVAAAVSGGFVASVR